MIIELLPDVLIEAQEISFVKSADKIIITFVKDIPYNDINIEINNVINVIANNIIYLDNFSILDIWNIQEENKLIIYGEEIINQ